ncbi:PDR/VanB family oxidoreductase [Actinomadura viridis]|uniref:Ferredoxin-NADP reductase n=1 Tax=Actinomadura viridis TaxID=58110 RepID=A0A931DKI9_9ACTN|nr:PDR/VanB family oxidoreductase [Actinomadura viridis]MBG6088725.1 ferredoxin-NADP reductase [Actinomadura viridis]
MTTGTATARDDAAAAGARAGEPEMLLRVAGKDAVAAGVVVLELAAPDGRALPDWAPGAHVELVLGNGLTRQYSLCGDPRLNTVWRLGVLREADSRGGSAYVHDALRVGDEVRVRGPRNNFVLAAAPRYVFVAGGIGITPILPMLADAQRRGADWRLCYGGRTRDSMAFLDELAGYGDRVSVFPQDVSGPLDLDAILDTAPADGALVYCCGPEGLLDAVTRRAASWPPDTLRVERFRNRTPAEPARDAPFEVVCEMSGVTLLVEPGQTIVDVAEEAGIGVMYSCAEGTCGTCETPVLDGPVDHRDAYLTGEQRAAGDRMMICVSRGAGPRLVLDL